MKSFQLDPDSLAPSFLDQLLGDINAGPDLPEAARTRCLANLQGAEELVYQEIVNLLTEQNAIAVLRLINIKSEITCLNKKLSRS